LILLIYVIVTTHFNYLSGLAGLLSASLLTLLFLILWENNKSRNREDVYLRALMKEVENNITIMRFNIEKLENENHKIDNATFELEPIYHIQFDIWYSLKQNMSLDFLGIDIVKLEAFVFQSHRFNEMVELRNDILKSPLIKVKHGDRGIFENFFLLRKKYNEMLIKLCNFALQYLEDALKSRGKLIILDKHTQKHYNSFSDAIKRNNIIIQSSELENELKELYLNKDTIIVYQYFV
jgi:hypothetical protein